MLIWAARYAQAVGPDPRFSTVQAEPSRAGAPRLGLRVGVGDAPSKSRFRSKLAELGAWVAFMIS
eukprot:317046-Rhodomonas_salina.1